MWRKAVFLDGDLIEEDEYHTLSIIHGHHFIFNQSEIIPTSLLKILVFSLLLAFSHLCIKLSKFPNHKASKCHTVYREAGAHFNISYRKEITPVLLILWRRQYIAILCACMFFNTIKSYFLLWIQFRSARWLSTCGQSFRDPTPPTPYHHHFQSMTLGFLASSWWIQRRWRWNQCFSLSWSGGNTYHFHSQSLDKNWLRSSIQVQQWWKI